MIDEVSFDKALSNTYLSYLYRDADNYKHEHTVVFTGAATKEAAQALLNYVGPLDGFVPSEVGLPDLQEQMLTGWTPGVDHPYHEVISIGLTNKETSVGETFDDLAERWLKADWAAASTRVISKHEGG